MLWDEKKANFRSFSVTSWYLCFQEETFTQCVMIVTLKLDGVTHILSCVRRKKMMTYSLCSMLLNCIPLILVTKLLLIELRGLYLFCYAYLIDEDQTTFSGWFTYDYFALRLVKSICRLGLLFGLRIRR